MNRGARARYVCFDCNESTKAVVQVYRVIRYEGGATNKATTFVHRAGTGCHKADTSAEVREIR